MYNSFKKNKIGFLLMFVFVLFGFAFAAEDDCSSVDAILQPNIIFSKEDIEVAKTHLISHCCEIKKTKKGVSAPFGESAYTGNGLCMIEYENGPDSPYWMDHLIDVGIRKLSAREMYPSMIAGDQQGEEWLTFLKQEQNIPSNVSIKFRDVWTISIYPDGKSPLNSNNATLGDKYINLCSTVMSMLENRIKDAPDMTNYYDNCMQIVRSKMREETSIAYNISEGAGADMLKKGWDSFLKQFTQNRLMIIKDKMFAISSLFNTLAKQAPLSRTCTL